MREVEDKYRSPQPRADPGGVDAAAVALDRARQPGPAHLRSSVGDAGYPRELLRTTSVSMTLALRPLASVIGLVAAALLVAGCTAGRVRRRRQARLPPAQAASTTRTMSRAHCSMTDACSPSSPGARRHVCRWSTRSRPRVRPSRSRSWIRTAMAPRRPARPTSRRARASVRFRGSGSDRRHHPQRLLRRHHRRCGPRRRPGRDGGRRAPRPSTCPPPAGSTTAVSSCSPGALRPARRSSIRSRDRGARGDGDVRDRRRPGLHDGHGAGVRPSLSFGEDTVDDDAPFTLTLVGGALDGTVEVR